MDQISDKVGIMGLPEVFYGFNHLYVSNKEHNVVLDFNAVDSLSYSGFDKREQFLDPAGRNDFVKPDATSTTVEQVTADLGKLILEQSGLSESERSLNLVDIIPASIRVEQAKHWVNKDTSKIKDFRQMIETSDWTFSTPYKGTVRYLSKASKQIKDETNLSLEANSKASEDHLTIVQLPEASIPFEKLSPENPILHFSEVYLFECDLEDCGYAMSKVRFRVMGDCFYVLLRYYLRVDGVRVRIFDTRIFHEFGTDFVHREFQYRESTYKELQ